MRAGLVIAVVALTSLAGYLYGGRALRLSRQGLRSAWMGMLECVWLSLLFYALNLFVVLAIVLLWRLMGGFVSLYVATDITLLIFSLLQGTLLELWRRGVSRVNTGPSS